MYYAILNINTGRYVSDVTDDGSFSRSTHDIYNALLFETLEEAAEALAMRYLWVGSNVSGTIQPGGRFHPSSYTIVKVVEETVVHTRLRMERL